MIQHSISTRDISIPPGSNKFSRVLRSTFTQVPWIRSCKMLKDHLSCWESLGIAGHLEPNMGSYESPAGDLMTEWILRSIAASQSFEQHWEEYDQQPLTQATKNDQHPGTRNHGNLTSKGVRPMSFVRPFHFNVKHIKHIKHLINKLQYYMHRWSPVSPLYNNCSPSSTFRDSSKQSIPSDGFKGWRPEDSAKCQRQCASHANCQQHNCQYGHCLQLEGKYRQKKYWNWYELV